jgi:hypothetical protein
MEGALLGVYHGPEEGFPHLIKRPIYGRQNKRLA